MTKINQKNFSKKNKNTFPKNIFIKNFQFCIASNNHDHSSDVIQKCDKIISIFFLYKSEKTSCDTVYSTRFGKNWPSSSRILGGLDPFAAKTVVDVKRSTIPLQFRFAGEFVPLNTKSERWKKDSCFLASARKCDCVLCFNVELYVTVTPIRSIFVSVSKKKESDEIFLTFFDAVGGLHQSIVQPKILGPSMKTRRRLIVNLGRYLSSGRCVLKIWMNKIICNPETSTVAIDFLKNKSHV